MAEVGKGLRSLTDNNMTAQVDDGIGTIVNGVGTVFYVHDDCIEVGTELTTYEDIKEAYDIITAANMHDDLCDISIGNLTLNIRRKDMIELMRAVNKLRMDAFRNDNCCINSKKDLSYDDLCTLESLVGYFDVPLELLLEIEQLKVEALLSDYNEVYRELEHMKSYNTVIESMNTADGDD